MSQSDYTRRQALKVVHQLLEAGFESIETFDSEDLGDGIATEPDGRLRMEIEGQLWFLDLEEAE